jgi:futalosine hydrolase
LKTLIVSATEKETNLLIQQTSNLRKAGQWLNSGTIGNTEVDFLISGIGLPSVIYRLTSLLTKEKYDLVINPGIAGSFRDDLKTGSVVYVGREQFGDLGIDDNCEQKSLFELGYVDPNSTPFSGGKLINPMDILRYKTLVSLQKVNGLTVNMASGNQTDIANRWTKFTPDIETMEGAGIFYVCILLNVPFIEIRAISNKIEPRNIKNWNIPLALTNLSEVMSRLFKEFDQQK